MDPREIVSTHYDRRAASYGRNFRASNYFSELSFRQRQRLMLEWLRTSQGRRILDVGCGPGLQSESLARDNFLVGLDLSPKMLQFAGGHLKPIQGEAEALPFRDRFFDVILAIEVLQHVCRPEVFLKELGRVLRPGGQLIFSTLNPDSWAQRVFRRFGLNPGLYLYHSLEEICSLLDGKEWICLEKRFLGYPLPCTWQVRSASSSFSFLASAWIARFQKKSTASGPSQ